MSFVRWLFLSAIVLAAVACAPAAAPGTTAPPASATVQAAPKAAETSVQAKPTAAPKTLTKVRMSHASVGIFRLPLYIAIQNGYFKEEGIDLQVVETQSGSDAMKMLAGGSVEFSTGQLLDAINLNKEGINIQGVSLLTNKLANGILVRKALVGQIKGMQDLKGPNRTIGITGVGSGTWQFAIYMAQQAGLKKEDLNFVSVGAGANVIGAVKAGRVDAVSYADPEASRMVADGDAEFLIDMTDEATHQKYIGQTYLNNQIMVSADYAKSKPEIVQAFVNAIQRGMNWANANSPDEVARVIKGFPGFQDFEPALLVTTLKRAGNSVPKTAVITKDAFDNAMKLPISVGVITEPMPYERLVNTQFAEKAATNYPPGR